MRKRKRYQSSSLKRQQRPFTSEFADLSSHRLIERFRRLKGISEHPERLRRSTRERRTRLIELYVAAEHEIHHRVNQSDQEVLDLLAQDSADSLAPLIQADIPDVPRNLPRIPNEQLDHLTLDVERRIARFGEYYPNLDEAQSGTVREVLDAHRRSLLAARATRRLPPLVAARAEAAYTEPARNTTIPAKEPTEREQRIWAVIQRGSTGCQYCRELGNAGIAPRKSGAWKGCPRTYISAYQQGEPWCHRIQDEKFKIRRKVEKWNLRDSQDSPASKSIRPTKPA